MKLSLDHILKRKYTKMKKPEENLLLICRILSFFIFALMIGFFLLTVSLCFIIDLQKNWISLLFLFIMQVFFTFVFLKTICSDKLRNFHRLIDTSIFALGLAIVGISIWLLGRLVVDFHTPALLYNFLRP